MNEKKWDSNKWNSLIGDMFSNYEPVYQDYDDNSSRNKNLLWKEFAKMLGITEEELKFKDEAWIKAKIRQFKIKSIDG